LGSRRERRDHDVNVGTLILFLLALLLARWILRWFLGIQASDRRIEKLGRAIQALRGASPMEVLPRKVTVYSGRLPLHLTSLAGELSLLTIQNGDPGLQTLKAVVNERSYSVPLEPKELRRLDLSRDLNPGDDNSVTLSGEGELLDYFATVVLST
jgi:hypothetical protein